MKTSLLSIFAIALISAGMASGQELNPPRNDAKELRDEVQRVEAEVDRLNAHLKQLKERLAKMDGQSAIHHFPYRLRFPMGVERAMMGEAVPRNIAPQPDSNLFDNKKVGPGGFGPAPTPRK
jgi:hypothetical protein